jgi:hypothetical protein
MAEWPLTKGRRTTGAYTPPPLPSETIPPKKDKAQFQAQAKPKKAAAVVNRHGKWGKKS